MNSFKSALVSISCALIAILPVIFSPKGQLNNYPWIIIILIIILLIAGLFGDYIINFFKKFKKNYSSFEYQRYKSTLEYLDKEGKNVSLNTSININKLSLRWGEDTINTVYSDGYGKTKTENGQGIHVKVLSENDNQIKYSTNFSKNNILKKQHFTTFCTRFIDTFNKKGVNFYKIGPKHLCKNYEFVLIYPSPDAEITLTFKKGDKCEDGTCKEWINDNETTYTTYNRFGCKLAKVLYHNIPNTEVRMVTWEIN